MKHSVQKIINKLPKEKVDLATQKVDLGITQDVQADINSVTQSVKSVTRVMIDAEMMLGKNATAIQTIKKAIDRVKNTAIEIGASEVVRVMQRQEAEVKQLEKNINKAIQGIGNAMLNIR